MKVWAGKLCPVSQPLLLLDAASLYFRAFYGVPESITAPDGTPVNAVRGFTDMLARLITDRR
ncbi:MAG: flap endonuclease, partial [Pseudonocardia sp.]|nr:flap endonuclease [Pseudonocardia sp.]